MKNDSADRCAAPQILETDTTEDRIKVELATSSRPGGRSADPWPAIRQAVYVYARNPSEANALAVKECMRLLPGHPRHASH